MPGQVPHRTALDMCVRVCVCVCVCVCEGSRRAPAAVHLPPLLRVCVASPARPLYDQPRRAHGAACPQCSACRVLGEIARLTMAMTALV